MQLTICRIIKKKLIVLIVHQKKKKLTNTFLFEKKRISAKKAFL